MSSLARPVERWCLAALVVLATACPARSSGPAAAMPAAAPSPTTRSADAEIRRMEALGCPDFCATYVEEAWLARRDTLDAPPACLPADALQSGRAAIAGTLVDDHGQPLAGHTIVVADERGTTAAAETDAKGHFRVDAVPAGQYRVVASGPGGNQALARAHCVRAPGGATTRVALRVDSRANRRAACLKGEPAPPAGSLGGAVRSADGAPVRAELDIHGLDHCGLGSGETDGAGRFSVDALPAGAYEVEIFVGRHREVRDVTVGAGAVRLDVVVPTDVVRVESAYLGRLGQCRCRAPLIPVETAPRRPR